MSFCIAYGARPAPRQITLNPDELRAAAEAFDAYKAEGVTTVAAVAHAVRAVNVMRTPAPAADCVDCQRGDNTCPGHLPARQAVQA
ncbi:hypothetical protein SEA_HAMMY_51 [Mycobacterium phage Hammy]|uniref:Uncharacterized protein n=2 Tax=Amginevirus TaxID=2946794 RepID=A0A222ZQC0_9CAUD|nr:hypothetical protein I5G85_gp48 [Mycobacterium phage Amohnition]YP_009952009.1 hypothetical protein I5G86_gp48 [Mycobacterium phage DarthP]APD18214.1 hypothetical protein SEA_HAMMY_51 [Mycobacterium phage Hammy]ASR86331.1 hypothetical protein SEA_AMOHNITION_51 [Mycobacterium phage Amohnition]ASW31797.1 hypothetical protein SEA_DARTHP_51 [Mycobacterium phage DarthP]